MGLPSSARRYDRHSVAAGGKEPWAARPFRPPLRPDLDRPSQAPFGRGAIFNQDETRGPVRSVESPSNPHAPFTAAVAYGEDARPAWELGPCPAVALVLLGRADVRRRPAAGGRVTVRGTLSRPPGLAARPATPPRGSELPRVTGRCTPLKIGDAQGSSAGAASSADICRGGVRADFIKRVAPAIRAPCPGPEEPEQPRRASSPTTKDRRGANSKVVRAAGCLPPSRTNAPATGLRDHPPRSANGPTAQGTIFRLGPLPAPGSRAPPAASIQPGWVPLPASQFPPGRSIRPARPTR